LSAAVADTATVFETVVLAAGAVMDTVGGVVSGAGCRVSDAGALLPLIEAEMLTTWLLGTVPAVALKLTEVWPTVAVTVLGVVKSGLTFVMVITALLGVALVSHAVQTLVAFDTMMVGVHTSEEINTGAARVRLAVFGVPFNVAVTMAV